MDIFYVCILQYEYQRVLMTYKVKYFIKLETTSHVNGEDLPVNTVVQESRRSNYQHHVTWSFWPQRRFPNLNCHGLQNNKLHPHTAFVLVLCLGPQLQEEMGKTLWNNGALDRCDFASQSRSTAH